MDPYSGEVYKANEIKSLDEKTKGRLVRIEGKPKHIRRLSKAAKQYNKHKMQKRRKISKSSRKKNR